MAKVKPVKAWGLMWRGKLIAWAYPDKSWALSFADATEQLVRVEIRVVPKRRAKKERK